MPIDRSEWLREIKDVCVESKKRAVLQAVYTVYLSAWLTATSRDRFEVGTNVYERDWDVLLILDACRVDALRAVASEYTFLEEDAIESVWSVGSGTTEWLCKTFTEEYTDEVSETIFIGANGYINRTFHYGVYAPPVAIPFGWLKHEVVDADDFQELLNVFHARRDDDLRNVTPQDLTDVAIDGGRETKADRYIFHYSQPHTPHLAEALREGRAITDDEHNPWPYLRRGELSYETAWKRYLDNLRVALDSIELLLKNFDADRVAISADHGESFGEMRVHGHPTGWPHPIVKKVPWTIVSAEDTESYEPESVADVDKEELTERNVNQHLEDLGYL